MVSKGATIIAQGPLETFPYEYAPNDGVFHIVAPFTGGRFEPTPQPPRKLANGTPSVWPALDGIDGVFELRNNKLRFDIPRAHYKGVQLSKVIGRIDDLGHPAESPLLIEGRAHGPLADLIDYTNHSALGGLSGHVGEKLRAQGPASLALKLTIPQHVKHPHTRVEGALAFGGNTLESDGLPPLSQLRGTVRFTQQSAELDRLSARLLGGAVHANGRFRRNDGYAFDVDGRIAVDSARGLNLHGPAAALLGRVVGDAPYRLAVRGAKGGLPEITASSDLTGLALDFPAPFTKPAGTPMPFGFTLAPLPPEDGRALEQAELKLGPVAATYVLDATRGEPVRAVRGALGMNRMPDLPREGVTARRRRHRARRRRLDRLRQDLARHAGIGRGTCGGRHAVGRAAAAGAAHRPGELRAEALRPALRHAQADQAQLGERDRRRLACRRSLAGQRGLEPGFGLPVLVAAR